MDNPRKDKDMVLDGTKNDATHEWWLDSMEIKPGTDVAITVTDKTIKDPYAGREARKYENPVPSRELVLEVMAQNSGPMGLEEIFKRLELRRDNEIEAMTRRLRAMERDGQLVRNRHGDYLPVDGSGLIRGRVSAHRDGFGFLVPDEGGDDLYLSARQMRSLLHGDRAVVRMVGVDRRGRREGALVEVLERHNQQIVGRFSKEKGIGFVAPDDNRIHQDILIPPENIGDAESGQIVIASIVEQPSKNAQPLGKIVEVLGEHMAPGMEIDIAVRTHSLPHEWPEDVLSEAAAFGAEVDTESLNGTKDLRSIPLLTIDGEDAKDFDDAVFCEPVSTGWRLLVAIADVSAYVKRGSALDREAQARGTSVYFPGQVIPMLPEVLSNGLCSLNPQVDRLCMVCDMQINREGKLTDFRFYEAVMRSHARLTYNEVSRLIVEKDQTMRTVFGPLVPHLDNLYALFHALLDARAQRGVMDIDSMEPRIEFGEERKIEQIVQVERNDAHRVIEECMITANVAAASFLLKHQMPALYRVHETPKEDKLRDLRDFLGQLGLHLSGGIKPQAKHFAQLLSEIQERPDKHLIQTILLRTQKQAHYTPDAIGHFGLALKAYSHFTSPIRRYPDLLVHRAIRHILDDGKPDDAEESYNDLVALGEHCSMTERRADDATRDAVAWLKCEYMQDKVGDDFDGLVSAVTSFGLFVELKDIYVEGLVHVTSLSNDYYQFDAVGHKLEGKRSGRTYRLGDDLRVKVVRVDLDERKIDFEPADLSKRHRKRK